MSIDKQKYEYFLAKYRTLDPDELHELGSRTRDLIDEARLAYQEVCKTTGIEPKKAPSVVERIQTLTPEKLEEEKRRSSELWNGSLAK